MLLLYMIIENKMNVVEIFVEGKFFHWQEKKLWETIYFYLDLYEKIKNTRI